MIRRSLDQLLDTLSRRDLLQCLHYVQARQARDDVIKKLLLDRLSRASRLPAQDHDELLTVPDVAARLKLSKPRIYELVKAGRLPTLRFGKQIRIPARALATAETTGELKLSNAFPPPGSEALT